jgi:hypothetical protein
VGLCNLGGIVQIVRLQKEECGDGPRLGRGDGGDLWTAIRAFGRENMGIELVASAVLTPGPHNRFLGAALLVGVSEAPGALPENKNKLFHKRAWFVGSGWDGTGLAAEAYPTESQHGHCNSHVTRAM